MSEQKSKRDLMRGLLAGLEERNLTEYGSIIEATLVHELLGIEIPSYAAKSVYDQLSMMELAAIDYCRSALINNGKYLAGTPSGYRVLLPSENKNQINNYMASADRKLSRALKLNRNTPSEANLANDNTETRIVMKMSGGRRHQGGLSSVTQNQ